MEQLKNKINIINENDMSLISVGMLVYNHEKFISDALEGILSQTYDRMELVILDDASTDRTVDIIEDYMPRLKNKFNAIKFIRNRKNSGSIPRNCNLIKKEVSGEYYFEVSGDDIILPNCIKLLYENLSTHPECALIHANAWVIGEDFHYGRLPEAATLLHGRRKQGIEDKSLFQRLMHGNFIVAPTVLLRTEIFKRHGYHDKTIAFEDYEYWTRLSLKEKFYYINDPVVLYRRSNQSITNYCAKSGEKKFCTSIEAVYKTKKKYIDKLCEKEKKECWETFYKNYAIECKIKCYMEALKKLDMYIQNEGLDTKSYNIDVLIRRKRKENQIIEKWKGGENNFTSYLEKYLRDRSIGSVAIYGYSFLARILHDELYKIDVRIDYVIDKKGKLLDVSIPVYTLNDNLPKVDLVIVAPPGLLQEIEPLLAGITVPILDLEDLWCSFRETKVNDYQ